ncbi:MAG: glycosyltransferase [Gallintestinimicrobium sp.]
MRRIFLSLEIILIDDGSPDRCGEICDNYAKKRCTDYHLP